MALHAVLCNLVYSGLGLLHGMSWVVAACVAIGWAGLGLAPARVGASAAPPPACLTWYDTTSHVSANRVHRSVGDFGAVGDGKTDDTKAIQPAIDAHRGTSLQKAPATVYFPPGVYLVSDTIVIYFHTYLFGPPSGWSAHPECRATLVLAEGASGFGSTTALKPLIATNNGFNRTMDGQWWVDPVDKNMLFFSQIHNLQLKLGESNVGATGILWAVAQQTSLRNLSIDAGGAYSALDVGVATNPCLYARGCHSCGGGGTVENIDITGGNYGIRTSASQWLFKSITITGSRVAGVSIPSNAWTLSMIDLHIFDVPIGMEILQNVSNMVLLNSSFGNIGTGAAINVPGGADLLLSGVSVVGVAWVVNGSLKANAIGTTNVDLWKLKGAVFVDGQQLPSEGSGEIPLQSLAGRVPIALRARPDIVHEVVPWNVLDSGARGDGTSDDTVALRTAALEHLVLFIPHGTYVVSDTISLRDGARVIGEGLSMLKLADDAPGYGDERSPKAVIRTPAVEDASVLIADIALSAGHRNYGAVLLEHAAGPASSFFDFHVQLFYAVHTGVHVTGAGGGLFQNMWIWGADHNLTDNSKMAPHLSAGTHWLGAQSGVRIDSAGPTWLVGTAAEHHRETMYNITGARDVTLLGSQTEQPYWNRDIVGTPACDAKAVTVHNSERVVFWGAVWCSWFCNLKNGLENFTTNKATAVFSVWSNGAAESVVGDHRISVGKFVADI